MSADEVDKSGDGEPQRRGGPIRYMRRGIGAAACGFGRLVTRSVHRRHRRRGLGPPLGSLTATALDFPGAEDSVAEPCSSSTDAGLFGMLASFLQSAGSGSYLPQVAVTGNSLQIAAPGHQHTHHGTHFPMVLTPMSGGSRPHKHTHDGGHGHRHHHHRSNHHSRAELPAQQEDVEASTVTVRQAHGPHDLSQQHLIAVGSRQWGNWWDGRGLLKVRIYDFAVYVDTQQARQALVSESRGRLGLRRRAAQRAQVSGAADRIKGHPGVPMSLTIRAARNLPLPMLSQEFERILQRRHEKVGGSSDDPALREVLSFFTRERLPDNVVQGDAVRRGAAITFSRSTSGELVAEANGTLVGRVASPKICEALFDLYLGDQPVSKRAKAAAGEALMRLMDDEHSSYQPQPGERLLCTGSDPSTCILKLH